MIRLTLLAAAALGLAPAAAAGQGARSGGDGVYADSILFGQSAALSGPAAELGRNMNLGIRAATPPNVGELRARGFRVLVYTVNDAAVAERLFSWGATGIFTDFPDRMIGAVVAAGE